MLFRKNMPRSCTYCRYGTKLDENQILCTKRGVVDISFSCRKFKYDPCKRHPLKAKAPDFESYNDEDFTL